MRRLFVIAVSLLLSASHVVRAEGRCPPGMYPIDAPGVAACAPIPGYDAGPPAGPAIAPVNYVRRSTWGAIAQNASDGGAVGVSSDEASEEDARAHALSKCNAIGYGECKVELVYRDACAVLAWTVDAAGKPAAGVSVAGSDATVEAAARTAVARCRKDSNSECGVVYSDCTEPVVETVR